MAAFVLFAQVNRVSLITYPPVYSKTVVLDDAGVRSIWKGMLRQYGSSPGAKFAFKRLSGHTGGAQAPYVFKHFGYCSYFECIIFSNDFHENEFNVFYHSNYLLPFGDKESAVRFIGTIN